MAGGGEIPEEWRKGIISPIHKRGERGEVKNYRGVTLMCTAYKVYATILNAKLKAEVGDKLEEGQFGFRKGRGTMDAVYVVNYVANRELGKKRGKLYACFVDLKAAFDWVDRGRLAETMRKMGVGGRLRKRIMDIYKETKNVVKVGEKRTKEFWTTRGVRQGCPLSPTLFNIFLADLEEEMRKVKEGGVVIGREKVWSIIYADDITLMATSQEGLKHMLKRLRKYLERKGLTLSTEKSKILVFEKGEGGRRGGNGIGGRTG